MEHSMPWKNGNPPLYVVWRSMLARCYDPNFKQRKDYGGRGVKVCPQWRHDYKQFYADMAPRPEGTLLDRIDNDGDYTPENCRWATHKESQRNRRNTKRVTIQGKIHLVSELTERTGLKWDTIVERAEAGLTYEQVISKKRRFNLEGFKLGAAISAKKRNARTHCSRGHEYTPETTTWTTNGKYTWRSCKTCRDYRRKVRAGVIKE
jgi:hypothetical protein